MAQKEPLAPGLAAALASPQAHPHDPDAAAGVETIQTHLSHVFLTRARVVKIRKAVSLGFVDFSRRSERNADCLREVALNRRLAPDVYLGVAPIQRDATGSWTVGAPAETLAPADARGEVPEHAVVMRRLPEGGDALSRLGDGRLAPEALDATARVLARFHAAHPLPGAELPGPTAWLERAAAPARECFRELGDAAPERGVERIAERFEARLAAVAPALERRRRAGRAIDGHGDVHLQHVWFEPGRCEPLLIDCVEFDAALRQIDAASEVAFLAMDLAYRERPDLAERFLRRYAALRDDFDLYELVDLFASYRAAVRAKVAALAARDAEIAARQREAAAESVRRHLDLAARLLREPEPGALVLLCGSVGAGKSSVAARIADAAGAAVIASDRTRKHLAGLDPLDRGGKAAGSGLYRRERTEQVYAALLERAAPVLASGRSAILDASFGRRRHREAAARFAAERGVRALLVEVTCARDEAARRLSARAAAGSDPSDAGPELLDWSRERFEAPEEWPERLRLATDATGWPDRASGFGRALPSRWH